MPDCGDCGKRVVAVPVRDSRGRIGLRFVRSGRIIYLTGEVDDHVSEQRSHVDHESRHVVQRRQPAATEHSVPRLKLLKPRPEDGFDFLRQSFAHTAPLLRRLRASLTGSNDFGREIPEA